MANTRKKQTKKKVYKKRIVRKSPEPLSKMDQFYITLHEAYKAAKKAGFSETMAFWIMQERVLPDWIIGDGGVIPRIDPTDDEEDLD